MSFALFFAGAVLLIAAVRNTQSGANGLFTLLQGDFTGPNNFIFWLASLLVIGAIGYIPKAKPFSVALLALVILTIVLRKGTGLFSQFTSALGSTQSAAPAATTAATATPIPGFPSLTMPALSAIGAQP